MLRGPDALRWWPAVLATLFAVGSMLSLRHATSTGRITDRMGVASRNRRRQRFKIAVAEGWLGAVVASLLSIALWIRAITL